LEAISQLKKEKNTKGTFGDQLSSIRRLNFIWLMLSDYFVFL